MTNCWQKCIEKLTGLADVPDFVKDDPYLWVLESATWLDQRGWVLVGMVPILEGELASDMATPRAPFVTVYRMGQNGAHAVATLPEGHEYDPEPGCGPRGAILGRYWVRQRG